MTSFKTLHIKAKTARRFRTFSKTHFKTHTEALATMLDFFEINEVSPKEHLGPGGRTIEANLKKRINAVIAIIRNIEKHQTKPTQAMMQALFEAEKQTNKPTLVEKKQTRPTEQL